MNSRTILQRDDLMEFITHLYDGDLHAKCVLSPANATRATKGADKRAEHRIRDRLVGGIA